MSRLTRLTTLLPRVAVPWSGPSGWIGVDVGSCTLKLAQVQRRGHEWQLVRRWLSRYDVAGAPEPSPAAEVDLTPLLPQMQHIRRTFRGRQAAIAASMSLAGLRQIELPSGEGDELRSMVREELAAEEDVTDADWHFDYWDVSPPQNSPPLAQLAVVAARPQTVQHVCGQLSRAGLECQVWDGLPCALARAVQMAAPGARQPAVALDLGFRSALLTLVADGRPQFTRLLRGCNLESLTQPLCRELQLSAEECQHLLVNFGMHPELPQRTGAMAARATRQLLAGPLDELVAEVSRTLRYVEPQRGRAAAQRLWLFGGGATIRQLPELLESRLGLPVSTWSLPAADGTVRHTSDALFGPAAALSALAWEAQQCT